VEAKKMQVIDISVISEIPLIIIVLMALGGLLSFAIDLLSKNKRRVAGYLTLLILLISLTLGGYKVYYHLTYIPGYGLSFDAFSDFFLLLFLGISFLVVLSSLLYMKDDSRQGLYYGLIMYATIGLLIVASAVDLIILVVGWELAGLSTYALTAIRRDDPLSIEAAMKYFLVGAIGSGLAILGISYLFGVTGTTDLNGIYTALQTMDQTKLPLAYLGVAFLIAGIGFKMAIVPFHAWIPDTYEGAPTTITTYLAAASKKMGFAAAFRIFIYALPSLNNIWVTAFAILAVITMTYGNLAALVQRNIKRMMAYSSIGHAGYIIIALAAYASSTAVVGGLLHVLMHAIMKTAAFIAIISVWYVLRSHDLTAYAGLRKRAPITSFTLTVMLLSMAGIPPLGGFFSKYILFLGAVEAGLAWLAVAGVINSVISLFYYAWIIKLMLIDDPIDSLTKLQNEPKLYAGILIILTVFIVIFGLLMPYITDYLITAVNILHH